jgi:hypothetical protein
MELELLGGAEEHWTRRRQNRAGRGASARGPTTGEGNVARRRGLGAEPVGLLAALGVAAWGRRLDPWGREGAWQRCHRNTRQG